MATEGREPGRQAEGLGEPTAAELPMEEFLARFPPGTYTFFAVTIDASRRGGACYDSASVRAPSCFTFSPGSGRDEGVAVSEGVPTPIRAALPALIARP